MQNTRGILFISIQVQVVVSRQLSQGNEKWYRDFTYQQKKRKNGCHILSSTETEEVGLRYENLKYCWSKKLCNECNDITTIIMRIGYV